MVNENLVFPNILAKLATLPNFYLVSPRLIRNTISNLFERGYIEIADASISSENTFFD